MNTLVMSPVTPIQKISLGLRTFEALLMRLTPIADLAARLWVANVFFKSGLLKIQSWDSTLSLFMYEYHVPLLDPELAAWMGTFTELFFPVLLALGLGGRVVPGVLFVFNIIAVISYPDLDPVGVEQHQVWGVLLLISLSHGAGKLSLDYWIGKLLGHRRAHA